MLLARGTRLAQKLLCSRPLFDGFSRERARGRQLAITKQGEARTITRHVEPGARDGTPAKRAKCRGYSLVEMLMVIALLAIVSTIAYPSVQALYAKRTVGKAVDKFISHYALARSVAMQYGRTSRLHLDVGSGRVWISVDTSLVASGDTMTVEEPFSMADFGVGMTTTRSTFCFDPKGLPGRAASCTDTPATITFDRGAMSKTLEITSGGRIQR